ncbi:hypothetical protein [Pseudomonas sp. R37(2017)]|uniref:hypothetical protein n=1 Tax=Pseudomonas sp. R37(2017) TaxID=1981685 RepID=UPI003531E72D
MMQVMPATGKDLKLGDIRQLQPSIEAGVKFIRWMIGRNYRDEPMTELDKVLFTFAPYNVGPATELSFNLARRRNDEEIANGYAGDGGMHGTGDGVEHRPCQRGAHGHRRAMDNFVRAAQEGLSRRYF